MTIVTDEMRREVSIALARMGGLKNAAMITGIQEKILAGFASGGRTKFVTEDVMDRFCCLADTDLWITNYKWYTNGELKEMGLWAPRSDLLKEKDDTSDVYVSPYYSPEAISGVTRDEAGQFLPAGSSGDGPRGDDTDEDPRSATDD